MRFQLVTTLLLVVFLCLFVLLTACGPMPVASMVKLARVDFATTNLAALRAAVLLPIALRPLPGTGQLTLVIEPGDGSKIDHSVKLLEIDDAEAAMLNQEAKAGARVYAYTLSPKALRDLEQLRGEVLAARDRAKRRPRLTLHITADACRQSRLPAGALPITTYLKTAETRSFVPLARNVDLRTLGGDKPLVLLPCPS